MSLALLFYSDALCPVCYKPISRRPLYIDPETGYEEWGEWEPLPSHPGCRVQERHRAFLREVGR